MNSDQLKTWINDAQRAGAKAATITSIKRTGGNIRMRSNRPGPEEPIATEELRVTTWLDRGKKGVATGHPDQIKDLIADALGQAETASTKPLEGPVDRLLTPSTGIMINDRRYDRVTSEKRAELFASTLKSLQADRRFKTKALTLNHIRQHRAFASTTGQVADEQSTEYALDTKVMVKYRSDEFPLAARTSGRAWSTIATLPLSANLARRADRLCIPGTERLSGEVNAILRPQATARIVEMLGRGLNQASLSSDSFFLTPDAGVNLSKVLHLVDDGRVPGGLRTQAFDDQGVSAVPVNLIREGHIGMTPLTAVQARADDTRPTGHFFDGQLRPSNLLLRSGTRSIHALLTERDGMYLTIDDLLDWRKFNPATGVLSGKLNAEVMRGRNPIAAMRNASFKVNLGQALASVTDVTSDTDRHDHVDACGLFLGGFIIRASKST